jgi:hypothetical protein
MCQSLLPHRLLASNYPLALPTTEAATVAHLLDIRCPVAKLRSFMSDTPQWLPWAMPTLQSVQPLPFGQWLLKTPHHVLKLRLCPAPAPGEPGELLYELLVPQTGSCQILVRHRPHCYGLPGYCYAAQATAAPATRVHHERAPPPYRAARTQAIAGARLAASPYLSQRC